MSKNMCVNCMEETNTKIQTTKLLTNCERCGEYISWNLSNNNDDDDSIVSSEQTDNKYYTLYNRQDNCCCCKECQHKDECCTICCQRDDCCQHDNNCHNCCKSKKNCCHYLYDIYGMRWDDRTQSFYYPFERPS